MRRDLSPSQGDLADYMSSLSEQAYSVQWMDGLEFALWRAVARGPFKYGRLELTSQHVHRLLELSALCGGWIYFDDVQEESFAPLDEWKQRAASNN